VNWSSIRQSAATLVRLLLGVVWIWAGWDKLQDPRGFLRAVRAYDATPEWLSKAIAYGLPTLEVSIGVLLIVGLAVRAAALVSAVLFVVFLVGIIQASARGIKLECGCFGGGGATDKTSYTLDILRDVGLLACAVFLILWPLSHLAIESILVDHSDVAPPSAKRVRRDPNAIRKYEAVRAARRREQASKDRFITGVVTVVIILIAVIGIAVQSGRAKIQGTLTATNANATNGVTVGQASAPITLDVYEDFQCPICQEFESSTGADLTKLVSTGAIKINYHMMAFLDSQSSGNRYSSRAANAAICASDVSTAAFAVFHTYLYGNDSSGQKIQPAEGSDGRTDAQLEAYFKAAFPAETSDQATTFQSCVEGETYKALVEAITDNSSKKGVTGTPTVFVDGKKVDTVNTANVLAAIKAEQAKGKTPSATPSASTGAGGSSGASGSTTSTPTTASTAETSSTP
jgi:protein-disulfide isomerase